MGMDYASTKMNRIKYFYPDTTHHCTFYEAPQSSNIGSMDFTFPGYSEGKNREILTNSLFFDQISFPGWLIVHQKVNERRSMHKIIETINQFTSKRPSTLLKSTTGNDWVDPNRTYVRQFSCLSLTYEKRSIEKRSIVFFLRLKLPPSLT